jgi:DNA primase
MHTNATNPTSFAVFGGNRGYCFSCGWSGDLIQYKMDKDGLEFNPAVRALCDDFGIDIDKDETYVKQQSIADRNEQYVKSWEKKVDVCYDYLTKKRGLTDETIKHYRIGWSEKGSCITIPMTNQYNQTVGFLYRFFDKQPKYKNSKANELFHKGSFLFNINNVPKLLRKTKRLWVCEGGFDSMSAYQQGEASVSYCGITFSKDHVMLIKDLTKRIDGCQIILVPDADGKACKFVSRGRELFEQNFPDANVKVAVIGGDEH